jgi:germination protein M
MRGRISFVLRLLPIGAVLALAACGGNGGETTTTTGTTATTETTETTPPETTALRVYFLHKGKVQPVARDVPKTQAVARAALDELGKGPTAVERRDLRVSSTVSADFQSVNIENGVAEVQGAVDLSNLSLAQIVYTLTQFPTVKSVEIGGKRYTRADFEDETPIILVESPLPFQTVRSPLRATGTANTFEATFNYDLTDPDGIIIDSHFVTATSGSGERGTFDFTVPFTIDRSGYGALIVYELSAKDGSRIHINEIPIRMER